MKSVSKYQCEKEISIFLFFFIWLSFRFSAKQFLVIKNFSNLGMYLVKNLFFSSGVIVKISFLFLALRPVYVWVRFLSWKYLESIDGAFRIFERRYSFWKIFAPSSSDDSWVVISSRFAFWRRWKTLFPVMLLMQSYFTIFSFLFWLCSELVSFKFCKIFPPKNLIEAEYCCESCPKAFLRSLPLNVRSLTLFL